MSERPLVTFVLIAYNASAYVAEAVAAALAQTYRPLQIVLSDDHSSDDTFAIMQVVVSQYGGPHEVVLNRNDQNLGIGGHVNRAMQLARGEVIVIAAGDDISAPERTEKLMRVFTSSSRIIAAFSDCVEVDEQGQQIKAPSAKPPPHFDQLEEMCIHQFRGVTGATAAWRKSVFDLFGPMHSNVWFEDRVIPFRAAMLGKIGYISEPLVQYRRHGESTVGMFHSKSRQQMIRRLQCFYDVYINNMEDVNRGQTHGYVEEHLANKCRALMRREMGKLDGYIFYLSRYGSFTRYRGILRVLALGGNPLSVLRKRWAD